MPVNGAELLVLVVLAVVLVGPERLPEYARKLADLVVALKRLAGQGGDRLREELGPELDDLDLASLDPRQYDPRRIVREALADDPRSAPARAATRPAATPPAAAAPADAARADAAPTPAPDRAAPPVFDADAT